MALVCALSHVVNDVVVVRCLYILCSRLNCMIVGLPTTMSYDMSIILKGIFIDSGICSEAVT